MLKNSGYSVKDIANELHVAEPTVYKYLRNGKKIGINKEVCHNGSPILCVENGLVCTSKTQFIKHSEDIVGVRVGFCRLNTILANENCNINNYHLKLLSATDFDNIQKHTPSVIVG
jgi:orotate phosphoribosyltransferase-like protein